MTIDEIKRILVSSKEDLAMQYNVKSIGLFGSYVHGEQSKRSDLDILVDFTTPVGLFDLIRLEDHLSSMVGIKVDLVMKRALKRRIGENILQDVIYI
jgi:predicted nucleotidyltransferase